MLTVIYPSIKVNTGTRRYTERILKGLNDAKYPHKEIGIKKFEISVGGKPYGGIISQRIGLALHSKVDHPNHSLSPEVAPNNADIVTIFDIIPFTDNSKFVKSGYDKKAYKMMYENALKANILMVPTEIGKREVSDKLGIEEKRIRVVHHSIDLTRFFPDTVNPYPNDGKVHLVTVGDFNPRKRFDLLYDIIGKEREFHLYHIGPINSWKERAQQQMKIAESAGNITLLGEVDDGLLRRYLTNADLFVYISDAEGFGYPPIEAMACGTNVVVNDLDVFRETIGAGAVISTVDNFADSIHKALNSRKDSSFLRQFASKFSLEEEIGKMIKIYGEVASDR